MALGGKQISQKFTKRMVHPDGQDFVDTARKIVYYDDVADEYREVLVPGTNPMNGLEWDPTSFTTFWVTYGESYYDQRATPWRPPDLDLVSSVDVPDKVIRGALLALLDYINTERAEHSRAAITDGEFLIATLVRMASM